MGMNGITPRSLPLASLGSIVHGQVYSQLPPTVSMHADHTSSDSTFIFSRGVAFQWLRRSLTRKGHKVILSFHSLVSLTDISSILALVLSLATHICPTGITFHSC